jgi:hypothetical protein
VAAAHTENGLIRLRSESPHFLIGAVEISKWGQLGQQLSNQASIGATSKRRSLTPAIPLAPAQAAKN